MAKSRQTNARNEALKGLFLYTAGAAFGASGALLVGQPALEGAKVGLAVATGIFLKWQISGHNWRPRSRRPKTHARQFASALPWVINEGIDENGILRWYDKRDKPVDEFVFSGLDLPTKIPESMMYRFCDRALQRNRISLDPERRTYKRNGRKLRSHEVLSRGYFTGQMSPRFLPEQYDAIKEVLELTGYWINGRGGHPGILMVDYGTSPQKLVHRVRWGWIDIIVRADKNKSRLPWQ